MFITFFKSSGKKQSIAFPGPSLTLALIALILNHLANELLQTTTDAVWSNVFNLRQCDGT